MPLNLDQVGNWLEIHAEDVQAMSSASTQQKSQFVDQLLAILAQQSLSLHICPHLCQVDTGNGLIPACGLADRGCPSAVFSRTHGKYVWDCRLPNQCSDYMTEPEPVAPPQLVPSNPTRPVQPVPSVAAPRPAPSRPVTNQPHPPSAPAMREIGVGASGHKYRGSTPTGQQIKVGERVGEIEALQGADTTQVARIRYQDKPVATVIKSGLTGQTRRFQVEEGDEICSQSRAKGALVRNYKGNNARRNESTGGLNNPKKTFLIQ